MHRKRGTVRNFTYLSPLPYTHTQVKWWTENIHSQFVKLGNTQKHRPWHAAEKSRWETFALEVPFKVTWHLRGFMAWRRRTNRKVRNCYQTDVWNVKVKPSGKKINIFTFTERCTPCRGYTDTSTFFIPVAEIKTVCKNQGFRKGVKSFDGLNTRNVASNVFLSQKGSNASGS